MPSVGFQSADKTDNPVVKLRPPHLDDELVPEREEDGEKGHISQGGQSNAVFTSYHSDCNYKKANYVNL